MTLQKLFDRAAARAADRRIIKGKVGKHNPDTTVTYTVAGRVDKLWVTLADRTAVEARNEAGVPQSEDYPVKLIVVNGEHLIIGRDTSGALAAPSATPPSGVLAHAMEEHSDVVFTSAADGDVFAYNGDEWVNETPVASSAGAGDAGKLIRLDAGGQVDATMLDIAGAIDAATELTDPAGSSFAVTLSGVLRWISYSNLLAAVQAAFLTFTNQIAIVATATTGSAFRVVRDLTAASTDAPVVDIVQDHASDDQAALRVRQDGSGNVATLTGSDGSTIVDRFGNFSATGANATAGINGTGVVSLRISKTDGSGHDWRIEQQRNTTDGSLEINDVADLGNSRVVIGPTGDVGIGVTAPQGRLQVHDGNGGMMFVTRTGIVGTPITVIPDGLGDVVRGVKIDGVAYNTVPQTRGFDITVPVSGSGEVDALGTGVNVLTFAVSAGGALTVSRTAGSATWEFAANLKWL